MIKVREMVRRLLDDGWYRTWHLQGDPAASGTRGRTMNTSRESAARRRVEELERLCGELYQFAGEVGAPARILNALWAAAQGRKLPGDGLLPVRAEECSEIAALMGQLEEVRRIVATGPAAAELGRLGGRKTSPAKRRAAAANGRRGGRPRKATVNR